ncbi:ankyrin-3-like [Lolium rigidum]|uniref:ankyrin-3-like n=1 Tax=Lolium rigidum TaxID=89674 RepID=UPI001F5E044C|nr:ankyrin-3-like [Lolium rigidum]
MRSQLLDAAIDGDIGSFKRFARALHKGSGHLRDTVEGVRTEDEDTRGLGALHLAAGSGKLDMCRYLVEVLGVDVDAVDHGGRTPLIQAIYNEKVNTAKYLLDQGANQDKTSDDGQLLERGAYPDPVNGCGTPLHIVAAECDDRSMKILLDHNADYNKMVNGMTSLYFAINATSVKCVKLLVEVLEPVDKRKIQELKSKGSKAVGRRDFLSAAELYSMAMELDPNDATLFSNRSLCWLQLGKPLLGLLDALECKSRRPSWPKALYRQSKALMSLKDYKGACEAFLDALKLDPGNDEIEDGLRNAMASLKVSRSTKAE